MPNRSIDITIGGYKHDATVVSEDHFGAIQTGHTRSKLFDDQADTLGIGHIRWPGGTMSELETDIYGLDIPDLFDATNLFKHNPNRDRPGLSDMLEKCISDDCSFSMIIPTARYESDIERGVQEVEAFMGDLLGGAFGEIPRDFTLEIGNEYDGKFLGGASAYGEIANKFIAAISSALKNENTNPDSHEIKIGIQMGYSHTDDVSIRSQIDLENLSEIDTLVAHSLPLRFEAVDKTVKSGQSEHDKGESGWENDVDNFETWSSMIEEYGGSSDPDFYISAWNVGAGKFDPNDVLLEFQDYGLRAGSANLELVSTYIDAGVDMMAVWGVGATNLNFISKNEGGEAFLSPGGEVFRQMAEVLPGTKLHDGYQLNSRDDEFMQYVFEGEDRIVVFLAANDIPPEGLSVTLNVGLDTEIGYVHAESVGAHLNDEFMGGFDDAESRIHEIADITRTSFRGDLDSFTVELEQDFEIVRVVLSKGAPSNDLLSGLIQPYADPDPNLLSVEIGASSQSITFVGETGDDVIYGNDGHDTLYGKGGSDAIFSGGGDDVIVAGSGDDQAYGEGGDDKLKGGWGSDRLFGGAGNDILNGNQGSDSLHGDWGNDIISGAKGDDFIYGGLGEDRISGGWGNDFADGGRGDDSIRGFAGSDTLQGNDGKDFIHGGSGNDHLSGGRDNDEIRGGAGHDTLIGGGGHDEMGGGTGHDILQGNYGNDRLYGYDGNDLLVGGLGNDKLIGGKGDDVMIGGEGSDTMAGGAGSDTFVASSSKGVDTILDFKSGSSSDSDRLDFSNISEIDGFEDLIGNHMIETDNGVLFYWELEDEEEDDDVDGETDSGLYLAETIAETFDPLQFLF